MAEQTASEERGPSIAARRLVAVASPGPEPVVAKWPRAWRYGLVLGAPLLFWCGLFAIIHWG